MDYTTLKQKHQDEINSFPMFFAFSDLQYREAMAQLGLTPDDTDQVLQTSLGGIIRKTDAEALRALFARQHQERAAALDDDNYVLQGLLYELGNHEYCITGDPSDAAAALGLDIDYVEQDSRLSGLLRQAIVQYNADATW
jgi:hypothetical protein